MMKKIFTEFFKNIAQQYWIELTTTQPMCTYYFGPFLTRKGASLAQSGFIEDLETENAQVIKVKIKRCQPQELTIVSPLSDNSDFAFI